jgi:shikimate kinase
MNIILTGMMGCGKSTIAKDLSQQLKNYKLVDIDREIEKSTQKKISEIFLRHGEPFFRMLETEKIKLFCKKDNQIISIGGGAFESEENRKILCKDNLVIYLKASPQDIFERLKKEAGDKKRPLLRKDFSIEKITAIMEKREKNYKKAHKIIDTTGKTPYNIVQEIVGALND